MEPVDSQGSVHPAQRKLLHSRGFDSHPQLGGSQPGAGEERSFWSHDDLIQFAIESLHSGRAKECAIEIARAAGQPIRNPNESQVQQLNFSLLQWVLDNDRYYDAASMLWPKTLFNPEPRSTREVWDLWERSSQFLIQGAASMSKSFSLAVRLLLEWVRDPQYTTIKVLGPSEDHLQNNLFSHLVELHTNSAIKLPGKVQSLFIGMHTRARRGSISGVIVPLGRKAPAKIRGIKQFPRVKPHKKFGPLSRVFVFMDEVNKIPAGIWSDVDNILVNRKEDPAAFKIGGAYNPQDQADNVGIRAEPEWGWTSFDIDLHYSWKSKRGWDVLRLDATKCENIIEGREVYPGLQTKYGMDTIIKNSGGINSPGYYAMVRGAYPPKTQSFSVISQGLLNKSKAEVLWASAPKFYGGADIALEGGDKAVLAYGKWGLARGIKMTPSIEHPLGEEILFRRDGKPAFKHMLLLERLCPLPPCETVEMSNNIEKLCRQLGIRPECLCVDRTGNGTGVHDHLMKFWNGAVRGLNFYESASDRKIFSEDKKTPKEEYQRAVSEVWFSMQKLLEFDYLKIDPKVDTTELNSQLSGRLFATGSLARVESKKEYCSRGFESPNEADALGLMVHAMRMDSDVGLTMNPIPGEVGKEEDDDGTFFYIDPTNMYDSMS